MRIWLKIIDWFGTVTERYAIIIDFNRNAKEAFILGVIPILLKATTSKGDSRYKHQFSNFFASGFRIKAMQGRPMTKTDLIEIGGVILSDSALIRKLVVNGFDTLEVCGDHRTIGAKWELKDFIAIQ